MKRSVVWLVRKFWGLLAITIVFMAVVVQTGRLLSPLIEENKSELESYISELVGAPLTSEKLSFHWGGLLPELKFSQLQILGPDGEPVLSVDQAVAQLDFLSSLYSLELKIWQLSLTQVRANLQQDEDETWYLIKPTSAKPESPNTKSSNPLNALLSARDIDFTDVELRYSFNTGRERTFTLSKMSLQNQEGFHRLKAGLDLPEQDNAVVLLLEGEGSINNWRAFSGSGYLQISNYQLRDSVAIASEQMSLWQGIRDTRINSKIWVTLSPGKPLQLKGNLQAMRSEGGEYDQLPSWLDTDLWGFWNGRDDWQLQLQSLEFDNALSNASEIDLVVGQSAADVFTFFTPALDLGFWGRYIPQTGLLPEKVGSIFRTLSLEGKAQNLLIDVPLSKPSAFVAYANVEQASAESWQGIPKIAGLNGYLEVREQWGMVQIDSPDYFMMHYPTVYNIPFEFDRAQGAVAWRFDKDANEIFVNSSLLSFEGGLGKVNGYFSLGTPYFANTRNSDMTLQIGLQDGYAKSQALLVPYTTPQSLRQWLNDAVVGGGVPQAGFIYHGSIQKDNPNKTLQLGLDIDAAQLDYSKGWPQVKNFDAGLIVDDELMLADVFSGQFLDSALKNVRVSMDDNPKGEGPLLNLRGELEGPAQDLIRVLTDSPLHESVGESFDHWRMTGRMNAEIALNVPLQAGQPGLTQDITANLQSTNLLIEDLNLPINNLMGKLRYSDAGGLSSPGLVASLWGKPLVAAVATESFDAQMTSRINLKSPIDMMQLAQWARRPEVLFAEGTAEVEGNIYIALGDRKPSVPSVRLEFESQLNGVQLNLPSPFGKAQDESRDFKFSMDIFKQKSVYGFFYADKIDAELIQRKGKAVVGEVALMAERQLNPERDLWLTGHLDWLSKKALFSLVDDYQAHVKTMPAAGDETGTLDSALLKFNAHIEKFQWDELDFEAVQVRGGQTADGWEFELENNLFKGLLGLPDKPAPIRLALDYLKFPARAGAQTSSDFPEQSPDASDVLKGIDPRDVPAAEIRVAQVLFGDESYGAWSFDMLPMSNGLSIDNIVGNVRGVYVTGAGGSASGANLEWQVVDDQHQSTFKGMLSSTDVGSVLEQWHQPRLLESESASASADLFWRGTPLAFEVKQLRGGVQLRADEGRFIRSSANAESALLRLVGLFNFDSWVRRLQLDFSDVYRSGLAYDKIRGEVYFDQGMLQMIKPIKVETPSSELQMGGQINLNDETLNATMVATLPVGGNITTAAAFVAGLPAAAGVYLISKLFDKQIKKLTSVSYSIKGSWAEPDVKFNKLFDEKGAKDAGKKVQKQSSYNVDALDLAS